MTAKEIISPLKKNRTAEPSRVIDADMPLLDVLPLLLDAPGHELGVKDGGVALGIIDETSLLEGFGRMIAPRDDCSVITLECKPEAYSASSIAHAVEDSDAHLVDLISSPGPDGSLKVTLRVRLADPSAAAHSLERYGYDVVETHACGSSNRDSEIAIDRLLSLQALLNV